MREGAVSFLRGLAERDLRFAVLHRSHSPGEDDSGGVSSWEILIDPDHRSALDAAAHSVDLTPHAGPRGEPRSYEGSGWRIDVRTRLRYGRRVEWLTTGVDEKDVLRRAEPVGGIPMVAPSDRLVHLLLRALLSVGSLPTRYRHELATLMEELRARPTAAGRACERVQQELAPAVDWGDLLADIVLERWDDLLARARPLRALLWRRAPVASTLRYARTRCLGDAPARRRPDTPPPHEDGAPPHKSKGGLHGKRQIRGSSLLLGGRGLSTGLKFLAELLIVRYLTTTDYGAWTYALAAVVFLRGLTTLGLNRAIVRFLPIHLERGERDRFFGVTALVLGSLLVASTVVITLFFAFPGFVAGLAGASPDQPIDLLFIVIFLVPVDAIDDFLTGLCAAFTDSRTIFVRRYLLSPGLRIGVALTLILLQADVRVLAYGYLISGIVGIGYYAVMVLRAIRERGLLDGSLSTNVVLPVRDVLSYTVPVMIADWCWILMTTAGPLLLAYLSDMSAVALFQVVVPLVTLTQVVHQSFGVLFEPEASRLHARQDRAGLDRFYWTSAVWVTVLTFPMFAVTFTAAEPLTVLLYGARYAEAAPILSLLALGMFIDTVLGFNAPTLRVVGQVRWLVAVNVTAAVTIVGLSFLLIPRFGALGAATATAIAWALHAVMKQIALGAAAGVRAFGLEHPGPYLAVAVATAGLVGVRWMWPDNPLVVATAVTASVIVVWVTARRHLSIVSTFPELARVPFLKAVLG